MGKIFYYLTLKSGGLHFWKVFTIEKCWDGLLVFVQNTDEIWKRNIKLQDHFSVKQNGKTGTQLPKLLSHQLRILYSKHQTTSFWQVLFHARVNEKRVPDHLRFAFWNETIKTTKTICAEWRYTKTHFVLKLTIAIRLYVNVSWETTFLSLWREELNNIFFFVNVNACNNITVTIPASFDTKFQQRYPSFAFSTEAKHG